MTNTAVSMKRAINSSNKPLSSLVTIGIFYYPTPNHLSYNGSYGSLLVLFSALQIVTGVILVKQWTEKTLDLLISISVHNILITTFALKLE